MPGKKTLGSMMNPRPMQFTMGAKMYQDGVGDAAKRDMASGYEEVTGQVRGLGRYFKTPNGDVISANQLPPQIAMELGIKQGMKTTEMPSDMQAQLEMLRSERDSLDNPFGDEAQAIDAKIREIRKGGSSATQAPAKSNAMGRLLKEYLKGGKTDAGLKALAASNPNLTYKEAMSGMRLIKDPVGMKSAGHGRKMYQDGTGDASYDPYGNVRGDVGKDDPAYMGANKPGGRMYRDDLPEGRIDPNDPGFQEFLKSGSMEYFPEYHGMPIGGATGGGSIYGQSKYGEVNPDSGLPYVRGDRSAGYFDVLGAKHGSDMMHNLAVNPAMFAFDIEGDNTPSFLNRPLQGGIEGATNRDLAISAIERYNKNLAAEQAYRDYLDKQQGPTEGGKSYQIIRRPGQSDAFIVTE